MEKKKYELSRRKFLSSSAYAVIGVAGHSLLKSGPLWGASSGNKLKVALVGTGIRGCGTWGKALLENYGDVLEMVGLCQTIHGGQVPDFCGFQKDDRID